MIGSSVMKELITSQKFEKNISIDHDKEPREKSLAKENKQKILSCS